MTIPQLVAWLQGIATATDGTNQPTYVGDRLRLAASLLIQMEGLLNSQIRELESEVKRLEVEYSKGLV